MKYYANISLSNISQEKVGKIKMKIVIVGAGAMGSRFGFMLKQAGQDVALIDGWDKNVEALQKDGIIANYNGEEIQQINRTITK